MKLYLLLSFFTLIIALAAPILMEAPRVQAAQHELDAAILKALTPRSHAVHITRSITDDRGLTSLQFTQDGREWGLDYLTKHELDSLKAIK